MRNKLINLIAFLGFLIIIAAFPMEVSAVTQDELDEFHTKQNKLAEQGVTYQELEEYYKSVGANDYASCTAALDKAIATGYFESNKSKPNTSAQASTATPEPVHEHKYSTKLTKDPTCYEEGILTYTCECGDTYEETVPKLEHNYISNITKEPACTIDGEKTFKCSLCGDTYTEAIDATGHKDGQFVITKEPTCTQKGERTVHCKICQTEIRTEEIEATGHEKTVTMTIEPTNLGELAVSFFAPGYYREEVTCMKCQEVLETNIIPVPMWHYILTGGVGGLILLRIFILSVKKCGKRVFNAFW